MHFLIKKKYFTDKCSELKCLNKGECIIKGGIAVCNCIDRYTGHMCQTGMFQIFWYLCVNFTFSIIIVDAVNETVINRYCNVYLQHTKCW